MSNETHKVRVFRGRVKLEREFTLIVPHGVSESFIESMVEEVASGGAQSDLAEWYLDGALVHVKLALCDEREVALGYMGEEGAARPIDSWLATEAGRVPTDEVGETLTVTLDEDDDDNQFCLLDSAEWLRG